MDSNDPPVTADLPRRVGVYRLERILGRGGSGAVYEGLCDETGERVAVKLLLPEAAMERQQQARLRQEARVLGRLIHPGIARVLGVEALPAGGVALIMEYLDGVSLRQRLGPGPLPVPLALRWAGQVAAALAYAHAEGVVHRDLKPENIMLVAAPGGAPEEARVLDFGVAKAASGTLSGLHTRPETREGGILGTLRYMAPEQLLSARDVDGQADVFALGVVLYEMLTGVPPFGAEVPELALTAAPPVSPAERNAAVPAWLGGMVLTMLSRDPRQRPSMMAVAAALAPVPEGQCPFPGLEPFTEEESALFHGREWEVVEAQALLGTVHGGYRRWLQIEGASGSGKSSLLRAGLLPLWRRNGISGRPATTVVVFRPGCEPLLNLAQALVSAWPRLGALDAVLARLGEPMGLCHLLREVTAAAPGQAVLLAVDQFEEAFTLAAEMQAGAAQLDRLLAAALGDADGPLHLVTTLRSDFLAQIGLLQHLAPRLNQAGRYNLLPMSEAGLREAVLGPCARAGLRCEPGLVERVLSDTSGLPGCLPLLGHALRAVYEARSGDQLTLGAYLRVGGVSGALAQATESLLSGLGTQGRLRARRLLLSLVRIGRGAEDTRRSRSRDEALAAAGGDMEAWRVLQRLSGGRDPEMPASGRAQVRLVVASEERVELIHEAVLQHVPELRAWIEEDRRLLERCEELESVAKTWQAMDCSRQGLPEGLALGYYEGAGLPPEAGGRLWTMATAPARRYLAAARAQEQRSRRWRRASVTTLGAATLVFLGVAVFAVREQRRAVARETIALEYVEKTQRTVDEELAQLSGADYAREKLRKLADAALQELADAGVGGWRLAKARFFYEAQRADYAMNYASMAVAEQYYREGVRQAEIVERTAPDRSLGSRLRAEAYVQLGDLLRQQGQLGDALLLLQKAEGLLAKEQDPGSLLLRAQAARFIALIRWHEKRYPEAQGDLQRSETLLFQADPKGHETLGFLYYYRGCIALDAGDLAGARAALDAALAIERPLLPENPGYINYPWHLGRILTKKALVLAQQGDTAKARQDVDEALKRLEAIATLNEGHRLYRQALAEARQAAVEVERLAQTGHALSNQAAHSK